MGHPKLESAAAAHAIPTWVDVVGILIMDRPKLESAAAAHAIPTWAGVVEIPIMDRRKLESFQNCPIPQNGLK